jgi:hypothetical protein
MSSFVASGRSVSRWLVQCLVGRYGTIVWAAPLALLVGTGAYLSLISDNAGSGGANQGTVYSVAAVEAKLAQDPGSWLGRTIQVRGEIVPCMFPSSAGGGSCAELTSDSGRLEGHPKPEMPTAIALEVVRGGLDPVRRVLRGIPLLERLVPSPQEPQWGVIATYTVRLVVIPDGMCGVGTCAGARLLDSAP